MKIIISILSLFLSAIGISQPCLTSYTLTANPLPVNGNYNCGDVVTFCLTVNGWNTTNANWIHGIVPVFGSGWDLSTLTPGVPPSTVGPSTGTWGWWPSVTGTFLGNTYGPGFFFDLDNDGDPGNNFGDFSTTGPWTFCWTIAVNSGIDCISGDDLTVTVNVLGDSESGSWGSIGCVGDLSPILVSTIIPCPSPGIGGSLSLCSTNQPVNLFVYLGGIPTPGGTWVDEFGSQFSGVLDPSIHPSGTYTYTVSYPGCLDQSSDMVVTVNQFPNPGSDGSANLCDSLIINFDLNTLLSGADLGGSWIDPNGNSTSNILNSINNIPGIYHYVLQGIAPCPTNQSNFTISIQGLENPGQDNAVVLCENDQPIDLLDINMPSLNSGVWTNQLGDTISNIVDASQSDDMVATYTIQGQGPCSDIYLSSFVVVDIIDTPNIQFSTDPRYGCYPLEVNFDLQNPDISSIYDWDFGDGNMGSGDYVNNTYNLPGSYNANLTVTDINNCVWANSTIVDVFNPPNSDFYYLPPDPITTDNTTIQFVPITFDGNSSYIWDINGIRVDETRPTWTFPYIEGQHLVCLFIVDSIGCESQTCKILTVHNSFILNVPNSFTPDGDGVNDLFIPILDGERTEKSTFYIFDRWGNNIFSSSGELSPWDGKSGGEYLPTGVYAWRLVASDKYSSDTKEYFGHVTLLR